MKHFYNFQRFALICLVAFTTSYVSMAQDYDFVVNELGLCVMEAENYSEKVQVGEVGSGSESLWDTASSPADYSGEGGMKAVNPGAAPGGSTEIPTAVSGYLRYNINFTDPGQYFVWARASHLSGSDDSFHAAIAQGDEIKSQAVFINFEDVTADPNIGVWVWAFHSELAVGPASVMVPTAGVYNFRIYIRERDFRIDKIILSRNPGYIPEGMGPDETTRVTGLDDLAYRNKMSTMIYPNPFAEQATLYYELEKQQHVNIKVYNPLGEEIAVLANEIQMRGEHTISLNLPESVNKLKSGIYLIRFQTGSKVEIIKAFVIN